MESTTPAGDRTPSTSARTAPASTRAFSHQASPREIALAGVTFYLGANLLAHMGEATDAIDSLIASAERAAGMLELFGGRAGGGVES